MYLTFSNSIFISLGVVFLSKCCYSFQISYNNATLVIEIKSTEIEFRT